MPDADSSKPSAHLSADETAFLRATAAARDQSLPLPPVEPLLEKWKKLHAATPPADVVPLSDYTAADALAFAARSAGTISPESRAKLARLVQEMSPPQSGNGQ